METDTLEKPEVETPTVLNANDRCDECGAEAYVHVLMEKGDLLFCAHHYSKYETKLADKAVQVIDERHKLLIRS